MPAAAGARERRAAARRRSSGSQSRVGRAEVRSRAAATDVEVVDGRGPGAIAQERAEQVGAEGAGQDGEGDGGGEVEHEPPPRRERRGRVPVNTARGAARTPMRPERPLGRMCTGVGRALARRNCRCRGGQFALAGPGGRDYSGSTLMARTRLAAAFVVPGADAGGRRRRSRMREATRRRRWTSGSSRRSASSGRKRSTAGSARSRSIRPTRPRYNNLAIAYEHDGQFDEARKALREGARARAEQRAHQAELRSVPRNQ